MLLKRRKRRQKRMVQDDKRLFNRDKFGNNPEKRVWLKTFARQVFLYVVLALTPAHLQLHSVCRNFTWMFGEWKTVFIISKCYRLLFYMYKITSEY